MRIFIKQVMFIRVWVFNFRILLLRLLGDFVEPSITALGIGILLTIVGIFYQNANNSFLLIKDPSFFYNSATLIGGALAIIVTLNSIILQNAIEKLPARTYKANSNYSLLNLVYLFLAFSTLFMFFLGLTYVNPDDTLKSEWVRVGLILDVWAFIFIFLYFRIVMDIVDPKNQITKLNTATHKKIDQNEKLIKQYTNLLKSTGVNETAIESDVRNTLMPKLSEIYSDLKDLSGLYKRFLERGDKDFALNCINSIFTISAYYYNARKESAIALPTEYLSLKSDLSDYSLKIDEIILPLWVTALKSNDVESIRSILLGYRQMIFSAIGVAHKNYSSENPLTPYILSGLRALLEEAVKARNTEALFQSAGRFSEIAIRLLSKNVTDNFRTSNFETAYTQINYIYRVASILKEDSVMKNSFDSSTQVMVAAIVSEIRDSQQIDAVIEQYSKTLQYVNDLKNQTTLSMGSEIAAQETLIRFVFGDVKSPPRKKDVSLIIHASKILFNSQLIAASREKTKLYVDFDRYFEVAGEAIVDLLVNYSSSISETHKAELNNIIATMIKLDSASISNFDFPDRGTGNSEVFAQKLAKIGMYAAHLKDYSISTAVIEHFVSAANELLSTKGNLNSKVYFSLRLYAYSSYIGAICHSQKHYASSRLLRYQIQKFEDTWVATLFPKGFVEGVHYTPSPNAVRTTLGGVSDGIGISGMPRFFDYPQDAVMKYIDVDDVTKFDDYLWRSKPQLIGTKPVDTKPSAKSPES